MSDLDPGYIYELHEDNGNWDLFSVQAKLAFAGPFPALNVFQDGGAVFVTEKTLAETLPCGCHTMAEFKVDHWIFASHLCDHHSKLGT